ncbi:hypothetical protein ACJ73_09282 [Blastomyces percursus]|uniref:Uncharacterized protein n=1 Tax=Blastomyces percursus TaxID=1658174 RepID=A0A1J9QCJ6_9EURO|nr:hypothetical protein ACJ73_09282 [Blastomyces percursus]
MNNQQAPLEDLTAEGTVRTTIGTLEPDNAAALWEKIGMEYNKYLTSRGVQFQYLIARHKKFADNIADFYHDMFLNVLARLPKGTLNNQSLSERTQPLRCLPYPRLPTQPIRSARSASRIGISRTLAGGCTSSWQQSSGGEVNKDKIITTASSGSTDSRRRRNKKDKDAGQKKDEASDLLASQPKCECIHCIFRIVWNCIQGLVFDTCASLNMTGEKNSLIQQKVDLKVSTTDGGKGQVKEI